jgi:hypothetical protein
MKNIDIDDIKEHILDFGSVIVLTLSVWFLFLNAYYNPLIQYNKTIDTLSKTYTKDELKLYGQVNEAKDKKKTQDTTLDTIPALLMRINNTAIAPKVIIRTLKPNLDNPFRFELKFIASYFDFINVLGEFEKLNITINKIDIKPYEISQQQQKHIITLDISAIDGGEVLSKKNIEFLNKELQKKHKRDPFQRFAKVGIVIDRTVDLTWIHKLSGIGKINGEYVATINRKPYRVGEMFKNLKITNIHSSGILLENKTNNGINKYILNFRIKNTKKATDEKQQ